MADAGEAIPACVMPTALQDEAAVHVSQRHVRSHLDGIGHEGSCCTAN